jgi:hypothetical protein
MKCPAAQWQSGHIFFEPRGDDQINQTTDTLANNKSL